MAKISRKLQTQKRHKRLRRYLIGSSARPRLAVFRSNNHIYAQLIDDSSSQTIVCGSSIEKEFRGMKGLPREIAFKVGEKVAERIKEKKLKKKINFF